MLREWLRRLVTVLVGSFVLLAGLIRVLLLRDREPAARSVDHPRDVSTRGVLGAGAGLVLGLVVALLVSSWLEMHLTGYPVRVRPPGAGVGSPAQTPAALPRQEPTPPLSGTPWTDLAALRRVEAQRLSSHGWVDRQRGIARIPIDEAMDLLARRGLPSRPAPVPSPVSRRSASGRFVGPPP
jgi:hypothetical protein